MRIGITRRSSYFSGGCLFWVMALMLIGAAALVVGAYAAMLLAGGLAAIGFVKLLGFLADYSRGGMDEVRRCRKQ